MARLAEVFAAKHITFGGQVSGSLVGCWQRCAPAAAQCMHGVSPLDRRRRRQQQQAVAGACPATPMRQLLSCLFPSLCALPHPLQKSSAALEMETSEGRGRKMWHLLPTRMHNRVRPAAAARIRLPRLGHAACAAGRLSAMEYACCTQSSLPLTPSSCCPSPVHRLQFRVKQTPPGAVPISPAESLEVPALLQHSQQQQQPVPQEAPPQSSAFAAAAAAAEAAEAGAARAAPSEAASGRASTNAASPQRFQSATLLREPGSGLARAGQMMRAGSLEQSPSAGSGEVTVNPQHAASKPVQFKQSPIEKMYRRVRGGSTQLAGWQAGQAGWCLECSKRHSDAASAVGARAHVGWLAAQPTIIHLPSPPTPPPLPPFLCNVCRRFWQRKGDVFHLLLGMALVLDDRCSF